MIFINNRLLFQQLIISRSSLSKMMIITNDQGMRLKIPDQKLADIILCCQLGEFFSKWNDHEMINAFSGKQFYFFVECVDELNTGSRFDYGSRMGIEGDDHGFAIHFSGSFFHLGNHLLMTRMYTIKSSNGEYGISKKG